MPTTTPAHREPSTTPRADGWVRLVPAVARPLRRVVVAGVREVRPVAPVAAPLAVAVLAVVVWAAWGSPALPALVVVAAVGAPLAVIDARTHRLPDALTLPALALTLVLVGLASWVAGDAGAWWRALVGAGASAFVHGVLWFVGAGIGLGDVKLVALLGLPLAWLGWGTHVGGLFVAYVLGGVWAVALLVTRRARLGTQVAFGPFLLLGALAAVVAS
jgi:leader peptidase (prepilin peptidase)/N-methyltransferase